MLTTSGGLLYSDKSARGFQSPPVPTAKLGISLLGGLPFCRLLPLSLSIACLTTHSSDHPLQRL